MRYSKKIVAMVIILNVLFAATVFIASFRNAVIPDSLIVAWFGFTTGELWALSKVSRTKIRRSVKEAQDGKDT